MKQKIFAVIVLACVLGTASVFATGIGAQAGTVAGHDFGFGGALTFKLDKSPWVFALHVDGLSTNYLGFGLTADNWLANPTFAKPFAYYYGWGLAGSFETFGNGARLFVGARLVGGINVFLAKAFELYAQVAWQPGLYVGVSGDYAGAHADFVAFPINLGFRFWF